MSRNLLAQVTVGGTAFACVQSVPSGTCTPTSTASLDYHERHQIIDEFIGRYVLADSQVISGVRIMGDLRDKSARG